MQLPEAEELAAKSKAKTIILLNAEWADTKSVASRHGSFVASFETAYCFQPVAIQARPNPSPVRLPLLAYCSSLVKTSTVGCFSLPSRQGHLQAVLGHAMLLNMRCSTCEYKQGLNPAQAFVVSTTQGALFAQATQAGSPANWQILKKGWGQSWKVIGRMQRRPTSQDLETAFYNASAAESPLTAGIRAVRQLVPGQKD